MRDIGKETHIHLVGTQFLFLLHLCLTGSTARSHHTTGITIEIVGNSCCQSQIDEPCPPRERRRWFNNHTYLALIAGCFVTGTVGCTYSERIVTRWQIGIAGSMTAARIYPVAVKSIKFIIIMYTLVFAKVKGRIRNAETILTMFQANFTTTVEHGIYRTVSHRTNQLIVDLQITKLQWELTQRIYLGRVEHGYTI